LGSNCGEQLFGFVVALTSCFEERQLWGVVLERNFGKPLSETTFGGRLSSCSEQLSMTNLGNGFGEQLCGAGLETSFGEQATLGSSFREPLWRIALGNALGNRFEA